MTLARLVLCLALVVPALLAAAGPVAAEPAAWSVAWQRHVPDPWQPASAGDLALLSGKNSLAAVAARTGQLVWQHQLAFSPAIGCGCLAAPTISLDGARVYTVSGGTALEALDLHTGQVLWRQELGSLALGQAVADDDLVVILAQPTTRDGQESVVALDPATGTVRWRAPAPVRVFGNPIIAADGVYLSGGEGVVLALDRRDGSPRWRHQSERALMGGLAPRHLWGDDLLLVLHDAGLDALERATGTRRWRFVPPEPGATQDSVVPSGASTPGTAPTNPVRQPAARPSWLAWEVSAATQVLTGAMDGRVWALDPVTGTPRWTATADAVAFDVPLLTPEVAVLATGDGLLALRLEDGKALWHRTLGWLSGPPTLAGDSILVGVQDRIQLLDVHSGVILAASRAPGPILGSPTAARPDEGEVRPAGAYMLVATWGNRGTASPPHFIGMFGPARPLPGLAILPRQSETVTLARATASVAAAIPPGPPTPAPVFQAKAGPPSPPAKTEESDQRLWQVWGKLLRTVVGRVIRLVADAGVG